MNNNLDALKKGLDDIPTKIGQLIEVSPEVWEILGGVYEEDYLFAKSIEVLENKKYKVEFSFPAYKIRKGGLGHVSAAQMQIAIFQGLFCSIGLYIKNNTNSPISFETYLKNREHALYRRDTRTFTKQLSFKEIGFLIFEITSIQKKGNIYSITCKMIRNKDTFIHGEVECILEDKFI